jgi:hypothetical protein
MVGRLLLCGMLVGVLAGIICFGFLKVAGEPAVDRAIAFEAQMDEEKEAKDKAAMPGMSMPAESPSPELVSRPVQAGIGLFTGVAVYSAAFGGIFALVFALLYGRVGNFGPREMSALLAGLGFVAIYLVPGLKYPANPPAAGEPETIGARTALYFAMIALSLAAMIAASLLHRRLLARLGSFDATLAAAAAYIVVMVAVALVLPVVNEVPDRFPAAVLWQFRIAWLGAQILMWGTIGLVFGKVAERLLPAAGPARLKPLPT